MSGDELIAALQALPPDERKLQVVYERCEYGVVFERGEHGESDPTLTYGCAVFGGVTVSKLETRAYRGQRAICLEESAV